MPALTTRKEARERLLKTIMAAVDRIIPEDESRPLKGSTFGEWEDQTDAFKRAVIPTLLEERAALEESARVERGGHCPYCGSDSIYLERQTTRTETTSPDGPVVFDKQHARCRTCDGSFSPSVP
jgi:DNA-directed RNA polymerase subunit RPC12/RpoP